MRKSFVACGVAAAAGCLLTAGLLPVPRAAAMGLRSLPGGDLRASRTNALPSGMNWVPTEAPLPGDADSNPIAEIFSVACPAVGTCVASGDYDSSGGQLGVIETLSDGRWTETEAPVPGSAAGGGYVSSVACPATNFCVAAGTYIDTLSGGTWTAAESPLPGNAGSALRGFLYHVACPAVSWCTAVGTYTDARGNGQIFIDTLSGGAWTAAQAPLPGDASSNPGAQVTALACGAAGSCVATGSYTDASGNGQIFIDTLSAGTWATTPAPLPGNASGNPAAHVQAVACPAAGSCVATGSFTDASGNGQVVIDTLSGGTWTAAQAPLPGNASGNPAAQAQALACPAVGSCVATGDYTDASGNFPAFIDTLSGGTWTAIQAPSLGQSVGANLFAVACPAVGSCVAVGQDFSRNRKGVIDTLSGGTWTAAQAPVPGPAVGAVLYAVACAAVNTCAAVGEYNDGAGGFPGLIETSGQPHPRVCRPALRADGTPRYVLILAAGIGSKTKIDSGPGGGSYPPLAVTRRPWGAGSTGYCFTATPAPDGHSYQETGYSFMPLPLQSIIDAYLTGADPSVEPRLLTNVLGAEGVVILPFSYNGTILSGNLRDPTLTVQPADSDVPGNDYPQTAADVMDQEMLSVHQVWPRARIIIVGHSEGGLVTETWWYNHGRHETGHAGVAAEFSLDSPINGVVLGATCFSPAAPLCGLENVSPWLGVYFSALWDDAETQDQHILTAEDGSYISVGTEGDPLFDLGDLGNGIRSQILFAPGKSCFAFGPGICNPEGLDFFSHCYPDQEHLSRLSGVQGHSLVKNCSNVIGYVGCVFLGKNPGCQLSGLPSTQLAGRNELTQAPPPPPIGMISPTALAAGDTAVITGQALGSGAGSVFFRAPHGAQVSATVQSWAGTRVTVSVPASAVTGPVELVTARGVPTGAGPITILPPAGPVQVVTAATGPTVRIGQQTFIRVTAMNSARQPVAGVKIHLSNGITTRTATTGPRGHAAFRVTATASQTYTAYSGSAFAQVTVTGALPRPMTLILRSSRHAYRHVRIMATLTYPDGKPAAGKIIRFTLIGHAGPKLSTHEARTNSSGVTTVTITSFVKSPFTLSATAPPAVAALEFNRPA